MSCLCLILLQCTLAGAVESRQAQDAGSAPQAAEQGTQSDVGQRGRASSTPAETQVLPIKHTVASDLAKVLMKLGGDVTVVPDESRNALVLRGNLSALQSVRSLIEQLDIPGSASGDSERLTVRTFSVQHAPLRELVQVLQNASRGQVTLGADERSRTLVASGSERMIKATVEEVIRTIDQPRTSLELDFYFIRAAIGRNPQPDSRTLLPASLGSVEKALREGGLDNLELMAPLRLSVDEASVFSQKASFDMIEQFAAEMRLQGSVSIAGGTEVYQCQLDADVKGIVRSASGGDLASRELFSLQTRVSGRLGEYLVLAAAPATTPDREVIALVLRVSRQGAASPPAKKQ